MGVTEGTVRRFIGAHYGGRASGPKALGGGAWSRAFGFTLDGRPVVVRLGQYPNDFEKDRIMGAFSTPELPIPKRRCVNWGSARRVTLSSQNGRRA